MLTLSCLCKIRHSCIQFIFELINIVLFYECQCCIYTYVCTILKGFGTNKKKKAKMSAKPETLGTDVKYLWKSVKTL